MSGPREVWSGADDIFFYSFFFSQLSAPDPCAALQPKPCEAPTVHTNSLDLLASLCSALAAKTPSSSPCGKRVSVWWSGMGRYYEGTVISSGVLVRYDDGEVHWESEYDLKGEFVKCLTCPKPRGHVGRCRGWSSLSTTTPRRQKRRRETDNAVRLTRFPRRAPSIVPAAWASDSSRVGSEDKGKQIDPKCATEKRGTVGPRRLGVDDGWDTVSARDWKTERVK